MSEPVPPTPFLVENNQDSKALDYAFVIAGWPTIYTVAKSYSLAGLTGALAGFQYAPNSSVQPWAGIPDAVGQTAKGRPEEGSYTISQIDVPVMDRVYGGVNQVSDLLSRQFYLQNNPGQNQSYPWQPPGTPGKVTFLTQPAQAFDTTINVAPGGTAGFGTGANNPGLIWIGQECIRYTSYTSSQFLGCSRGYLLTSPTPHLGPVAPGANTTYVNNSLVNSPAYEYGPASVYAFMPTLYRRRAFLFKGYQNLTLDNWAPAFGGVIGGVSKVGPRVSFSVFDAMWSLYLNGEQVILGAGNAPSQTPAGHLMGGLTLGADVLSGDFTVTVTGTPSAAALLGNGHYILSAAGHRMAITSVTTS